MFRDAKGTALLTTLIILVSIVGISGAMFFSSNSNSMMVHEQKITTRVFYIAETGINHGLVALNKMGFTSFDAALLGPDGEANTPDDGTVREIGRPTDGLDGTTSYGEGTKLFGGGACRVRVLDNDDGDSDPFSDSDGVILLQSVGMIGPRRKQIELFLRADMRPQSPFSKGPLTGDEEVKVEEGNFVAAINSALGVPLLEQIANSLFTSDGNVNSNGDLEIKKGSVIQGDVTSTASTETGDIKIDQDATIEGNVFTEEGDIDINSGATVTGYVATNSGSVDNEGNVPEGNILPEGSAQIPPNPYAEYQEQYDTLLAEQSGGSVAEIPVPTEPSDAGVPSINVFGNETFSGGVTTLGIPGNTTTYYFDTLSLKSGAVLNLLGDVTIIVDDKFDVNNPGTTINATGNVTFIVGEYDQHNDATLNIIGDFNLQASNSDNGDIRIDGTTTIGGNATIIAEDKLELASKSVITFGGNVVLAAIEDDVRLSGSATFNGETTIDAGSGVRFKADSSGQGAEGTYVFNGNVTVDALEDIKIENKTSIALNGDENYFFAQDNVEFKNNSTLLNLDPSRFFVYAWGEDPDVRIELEDSTPVGMAVFAPYGDIEIKANGEENAIVIGSFVGKEIKTSKNVAVFYDKNLDNFGPTNLFFFGYTSVAYKSY